MSHPKFNLLTLILIVLVISACGGGSTSISFSYNWTGDWNVELDPATGNCFCNEAGSFQNLPELDISQDDDNINAVFCSGPRCTSKFYSFEGQASNLDSTTPSFEAMGASSTCQVDDGTQAILSLSFVKNSSVNQDQATVTLEVDGTREGQPCHSRFEGTATR